MEIYQIRNKVNGKSYIGKTEVSFRHRYGSCWWKSTQNRLLKNSIKKYGFEAFEVLSLDTASSAKELELKEIKYIKKLNTVHPNGFNLTHGGEGCAQLDVTKKKISETMKSSPLPHRGKFDKKEKSQCKACGKEILSYRIRGLLKATCSDACFSVVSSERMKNSQKTKRIPVVGTHLKTGETLKFESIAEAIRSGFQESGIRRVIFYKTQHQHAGYKWELSK